MTDQEAKSLAPGQLWEAPEVNPGRGPVLYYIVSSRVTRKGHIVWTSVVMSGWSGPLPRTSSRRARFMQRDKLKRLA